MQTCPNLTVFSDVLWFLTVFIVFFEKLTGSFLGLWQSPGPFLVFWKVLEGCVYRAGSSKRFWETADLDLILEKLTYLHQVKTRIILTDWDLGQMYIPKRIKETDLLWFLFNLIFLKGLCCIFWGDAFLIQQIAVLIDGKSFCTNPFLGCLVQLTTSSFTWGEEKGVFVWGWIPWGTWLEPQGILVAPLSLQSSPGVDWVTRTILAA